MEAKRKAFDPHITWAADYCKHCFTCINICPVQNLKFEGDEMASLNKCIQCLLCEKYCPDFALEVEPKKAASRVKGGRQARNGPAGKMAKAKA
jgi:2-oxoglutarate ferredoxin oxidoreductase subunit delta